MDQILVIEDSRAMQRALQRLFSADSLTVRVASDGREGLEAFRAERPSAVVLDLRLPCIHGRELCREFKLAAPHVPIIVLSANSDVDDKVLLLELGADDYVTKPFSPKELLARVRRALRRSSPAAPAASDSADAKSQLLRFGDVTVDFEAMEVARAERPVALTAQEFRLLHYFADHAGRVLTREELLDQVWGYDHYPSTRTVDNHVARLRQKLEAMPSEPQHFITMHGAGYKFVVTPPPTRDSAEP